MGKKGVEKRRERQRRAQKMAKEKGKGVGCLAYSYGFATWERRLEGLKEGKNDREGQKKADICV